MPEETKPATPSPDSNFLKGLFNRSFELEMLVAGAFILLLLRLPSVLDSAQEYALTRTTDATFFAIVAVILAKGVIYILLGNLIAHLLLRCFWVGVIGINSVSENSATDDFKRYGKVYRAFTEKHWIPIDGIATRLDSLCRLLFGMSFTFLVLMLGVIIQSILLFILALVLKNMFFVSVPLMRVYMGVFAFLLLPPIAVFWLDKFLTKKNAGGKLWESIATRVFSFSRIINFFIIPISPVLATLAANVNRSRLMLIYFAYYALFFSITTFSNAKYNAFIYFPDNAKEHGIDYSHYESLMKSDVNSYLPTIQSDIITDKYIKLFIPYRNSDSDSLSAHFPDLDAFRNEGISFDSKPASDEQTQRALAAFKEFYRITINDSVIHGESAFFYTHPKTDMPGVMLYIPTDALPRGRNLLRLEKPFVRTRKEYFIPFFH
jgi:hypothetical protein